MNTDRPHEIGAPSAAEPVTIVDKRKRKRSAVTHSCPGGCGTELAARMFACGKCWRLVPHDMRQALIRTRPLKYLDAERLQAIHEAEDYLSGIAKGDGLRDLGWADTVDPVARATIAALEKSELSNQLGKACAVEYAKRKDMLPTALLPARHRGQR